MSLVSRDQSLVNVQSSDVSCSVVRGHTSNIVLTSAVVDTVQDRWRDVSALASLPANVVIPGIRSCRLSLLKSL